MRVILTTPQLLLVAGITALQLGGPSTATDTHSPAAPASVRPSTLGDAESWRPVVPRRIAFSQSLAGNAPDDPKGIHAFHFTRVIYTGFGRRGWGRKGWWVDYPKADRQFLFNLVRMTNVDAYELENPVRLDDPNLRRFPFLYVLEVGFMALTPPEVQGLRDYLLAGGFLFVDDFWGDREWYNFEREMTQVLPEYQIQELSLDHPAFSSFYDIDSIIQVPNIGNARRGWSTHENGGITPHVRASFDENERLMVLINWNTDLGDAWEWADDPYYPLRFSNFAWQMAINFIIYAMTH